MHLEAGLRGERCAARRCARIRRPRRHHRPPPRRRTRRRCESRSPARRRRPPPRSAPGRRAMNSETRMSAAPSSLHRRAQRLALTGNVEPALGRALLPPLRNDAGGVRAHRAGDLDHLARRRHFEIERFLQTRLSAEAISSSTMWRRSSRKCAVMPSAPAAIAIAAAFTGSGCRPPRALRTVATWSILTPRRMGEQYHRMTCVRSDLSVHPLGVGDTFLARNCEMIEVRCLRS